MPGRRSREMETEARTLEQVLNVHSDGRITPRSLSRSAWSRGYETALGAALGEDLEMPRSIEAAARQVEWRKRNADAGG